MSEILQQIKGQTPVLCVVWAILFAIFAVAVGELWLLTISIVFLLAAPIPVE